MTRTTIPKQPTIKVVLSHWGGDPVVRLNEFIRRCSEPSFNRWTNVACLEVVDRVITRPMVHSMVEFLNLPLAKDPSGTTDEESKWIGVQMKNCNIALRHITDCVAEEHYCTFDDVRALFSAMAHRALDVSISGSPTIVSSLLNICDAGDQIELDTLQIDQYEKLALSDYAKLGDVIGRHVQLKKLSLRMPFLDGHDELLAGLSNISKIQELTLKLGRNLADLLVGREGVDGPVMRLLRNPQNQLKKLSLNYMGLRDNHLITMLQMIPSSQIEELDFCENHIHVPVILEFANILPRMHSLKHFRCRWNNLKDPLLTDDERNKVGACLLQGVRENTSIETLHNVTESIPQGPLFWYYVALNRGGRRILTSSKPIPDGLWPLVLERAGDTDLYTHFYSVNDRRNYQARWASVNSVHYLLQNCPRILSLRCHCEATTQRTNATMK